MNTDLIIGRDIKSARDAVMAGGVIGYPTEGVFGLGCDPDNKQAIEKLLSIKKRSAELGFILIASSRVQLQPHIGELDPAIEAKLSESWPGPVTWVLPRSATAHNILTGGKNTIAARVTNHPIANSLCKECDSAIISTSANISGEPACTTAAEVVSVFGNELSYVLDYEVGDLEGPTPIFDGLTGNQLR